jgi:hypothetical protein
VLSFLAVLAINKSSRHVFCSLLSYSSKLLKFIKIAQILVVQQLVVATKEGEIEHLSAMLDKIREQFIVQGSRTAFNCKGLTLRVVARNDFR